jgi:F-type H+-transporting ATPase subunit gamma
MAKARKIRKRLAAVNKISTVTRTMEMVALARYRRARARVTSARPHTDRLTDLVGEMIQRGSVAELDHPLLCEPEGRKCDVLLVLTSNRGLCGQYNSSVLQVAVDRYEQLIDSGYEVRLWVSGRRGERRLTEWGLEVERTCEQLGYPPESEETGKLADEFITEFLEGRMSGLEVAYVQYISSGRQEPAISQILPLEHIEPPRRFTTRPGEPTQYECHPSSSEVLERLVPATVRLRLWQCFLDAGLSEHAMRIAAMRSATENADQMVRELTVKYNKVRQEQITAELTDLVSGRTGVE